jgi:cell division protein FtsB
LSSPQAPGRPDSLRPVIGAVVLLFFALLAAAGLKGYRDLTAARAHERELLTHIDETRNGIEHLRGRIDRLRGDPATLERMAREELGMVRPRDVVIELPPGGIDPEPRVVPTAPPPHTAQAPQPQAIPAAPPPLTAPAPQLQTKAAAPPHVVPTAPPHVVPPPHPG